MGIFPTLTQLGQNKSQRIDTRVSQLASCTGVSRSSSRVHKPTSLSIRLPPFTNCINCPATAMLYSALVCLLATVWHVSADTLETRVVTPVVEPTYQDVRRGNNITVQCIFPHPLIDCRVWLPTYNNVPPVADFGRGPQSPVLSYKDRFGGYTATYAGRGLSAGDCGVTLVLPSVYFLELVECLGRAADGSWSRGIATVHYNGWKVSPSTLLTPRRIVAAPGSEVAVLLKIDRRLDLCNLFTPADRRVDLYSNETTSNKRYRQHGRGLEQHECGFLLSNVTQRDAGIWTLFASSRPDTSIQATIVFVLSAPVGDPALDVSDLESLCAGSLLQATCRAPPSAPPANLTWLLDGRVVRRDQSNDTLLEDLTSARPWEPQPVVQTFTRNLSTEDMGKRLECHVDHAALSSPKIVALVLPASDTVPTSSVPTSSVPTSSVPTSSVPTSSVPTSSVPTSSVPTPSLPTPSVPTPADPAEVGCPALATNSMSASCSLEGITVDCGVAPVPLGTTARLACHQGYTPQINNPGAQITRCNMRKKWRPRPITCERDCGLRMGRTSSLSVGGNEAQSTEFPWHVGVFRKNNNSYKPICGGSLITLEFFISAAHCFWNGRSKNPKIDSEYKAATGKFSLTWEITDDQEQRRDVRAIHIPEHYAGQSKRFESDIAVVQLSTPVTATLAVGVVCLDWNTFFEYQQLTSNNMGLVPGWGITENNTMSPTLRYVDLPFVSYQDCHSSVPSDFTNHLLRDKFCGGYRNRSTSVCRGDSGGGFVFPKATLAGVRYYIRGVVSHAPVRRGPSSLVCQAEHMTMFTKISNYADWLEEIVFKDN